MESKTKTQRTAWHAALWIAQVVLAALFIFFGYLKTFVPLEQLAATLPMARETPGLTRFVGVVELLGGIGLILPALLRIRPRLTVLSAWGIALIMVLALFYHIFRAEYAALGTNIVLGVVATFVAWGRTAKAPVSNRAKAPVHR